MSKNNSDCSYVVGVGASAGGLEALEAFFANLPTNTGASFLVIQHLSPDFESVMDQLLRRHTHMPVVMAADGMALSPDKVFLIPPKTQLTLHGEALRVRPQERDRHPPLAIDTCFDSLAAEHRDRAIGVVLSGTGTDGSVGLRAIKSAGGVTMVQDPEEAQFDGMPNAAIRTGMIDLVLPASAMGKALNSYLNSTLLPLRDDSIQLDEDAIGRVFEILKSHTRVDFGQYRDKTLFRRLGRRMSILQVGSLAELAERLVDSDEEIEALFEDLLIGVTDFFRDPEFHQVWSSQIPMLHKLAAGGQIRVWIPGCSTGEEPYTVAMCFEEYAAANRTPIDYKIFATDLNRRALTHASEAVYSPAMADRIGPDRLERFFRRVDRGYRISPSLRGRVVFAPHNLIEDPPFTRMHLVSCRNLLIYFEKEAQERALRSMTFALRPGGMLMLGPSETLAGFDEHFDSLSARWKLFRRRGGSAMVVRGQADPAMLGAERAKTVMPIRQRSWLDLESVCNSFISQFVPACVLTDDRGRILHSFGEPNLYLRMSAGRATLDLLNMLSAEARSYIATAMHRAQSSGLPAVCNSVSFEIEGDSRNAMVTVRFLPPQDPKKAAGSFLILFGDPDLAQREGERIDVDTETLTRIQIIERELAETRENLNSSIEQLEGSNEELQSTNEELLSSNEELQSTNEELHSVNEELYTVNAEHQRKIHELTELTADMENLLESIDVGTIFLDRALCIRKFTPQARRMVRLASTDVGRPISDLSHSFAELDLETELRGVLERSEPVEFEGHDIEGVPRLVRLLPYRSNGEVTGAVITMIDVTRVHDTQRKLKRTREDFDLLLEHLEQVFWLYDAENRSIDFVSPYVEQLIGIPAEPGAQTTERWFQCIHPEDVDRVREAIEEVSPRQDLDIEYRVITSRGELRWVQARGRSINLPDGRTSRVVGLTEDITARKELQGVIEGQLRGAPSSGGLAACSGIGNLDQLRLALAQEEARSNDRPSSILLMMLRIDLREVPEPQQERAHEALRKTLANKLRRCDITSPIDESEFAVLLPHYDQARGLVLARSLHSEFEKLDVDVLPGERPLPLGLAMLQIPPELAQLDMRLNQLRHALREDPQRNAKGPLLLRIDQDGEIHTELVEATPLDRLLDVETIELRSHELHALDGVSPGAREWRVHSRLAGVEGAGALELLCNEQGGLSELDLLTLTQVLQLSERAERPGIDLVPMHSWLLSTAGLHRLREYVDAGQADGVCLLFNAAQFLTLPAQLHVHVEELRDLGFQVGLDEVGFGMTPLELLIEFAPDLVRFSTRSTNHLLRGGVHRIRFERTLRLLVDRRTRVCAAEIHNEAHRRLLQDLGVTLGSGPFWDEPKSAD
jgi:two-component system CheB/CheR fusion protein